MLPLQIEIDNSNLGFSNPQELLIAFMHFLGKRSIMRC